jgi:hypothetical protein
VHSLECTTGDCAYLGWPGATHVIRRTSSRFVYRTGKTTITATYGLTNLPPNETSAALLEALWRGHWTIESDSHYVRDVTLGEDRNHMRTGDAPEALAALRNVLLSLWRRAGWANMAGAVRATGASVTTAIQAVVSVSWPRAMAARMTSGYEPADWAWRAPRRVSTT